MTSSKDKQGEVFINHSHISSPLELSAKLATLFLGQTTTTAILEEILSGSLSLQASDIHFEPAKDVVKIRVRIDGVLREAGAIASEEYKYVLNRIKLLSGVKMNISETAQDGRFTVYYRDNSKNIEIRASINPSQYGATVVLRALDPNAAILRIEDIGLRIDDLDIINRNLKKPNGMILITGPTGSGKTTTLYAFINNINSPTLKIITVEDPIEYHLEGIQQTQVDVSIGYDFSNGLRSILRQDPDVILIGEIRDKETAGMAIQASLTGHTVFSTLHTNTAAGAIPRLLDLEVKSHAIGPSLNAILAQRLVRKLCPMCREKIVINEQYQGKVEQFILSLPNNIQFPEANLYQPVGCHNCIDGYKGRTGIFEIFEIDQGIEQLIHKESSEVEIQNYIATKGFITMQRDGIIKALMGITSLEEIKKTTGPLLW